jgi:hypothetical protein
MLLLAFGLVGVAVLGVVYGRGRRRSWWLGFALFAGGYLLLAFGPWFAEQVGPRLATTRGLEYVHSRAVWGPGTPPVDPVIHRSQLLKRREDLRLRLGRLQQAGGLNDRETQALQQSLQTRLSDLDRRFGAIQASSTLTAASAPGAAGSTPTPINRWKTLLPGAANYDPFLRVGHCLFAVLSGVIGGLVAIRFHALRERDESAAGR